MRKFSTLLSLLILISSASIAQNKVKLPNRAADHFMVQLNSDHWMGAPDSIKNHINGLSRGANVYLMLDKPFKGTPKLSIALGVGISTSNMFFKKMEVDVTSNTPTLPFTSLDSTNSFKKYKLSTTYVEIPLEFRFMSKPYNPNKSMKFALGVKGGTLLKAQTKGKTLRNSSGEILRNYTEKLSSKSYFNSTRISGTARIGYGIFTLNGSYSFTNLFKDGVAPDINTLQVGLTISGL